MGHVLCLTQLQRGFIQKLRQRHPFMITTLGSNLCCHYLAICRGFSRMGPAAILVSRLKYGRCQLQTCPLCVGRCSVSNVHRRPVVFGSVTVEHLCCCKSTPCNFTLASLVEEPHMWRSDLSEESLFFLDERIVFCSSELNQVHFRDKEGESIKCLGYRGSIAALLV